MTKKYAMIYNVPDSYKKIGLTYIIGVPYGYMPSNLSLSKTCKKLNQMGYIVPEVCRHKDNLIQLGLEELKGA